MKIRESFVSNSSSTSFVISRPRDTENSSVIIKTEVKLNEFVDKKIDSQKVLDEYIDDNYCWDGDTVQDALNSNKDAREEYQKIKSELEKGREVLILRVSDEGCGGGGMEAILTNRGIKQEDFENQDVTVLFGEGGY